MTKSSVLLSPAYLGPVSYFSKISEYPYVYIEQHEHFIKQTYRNRAVILGANGPIPLIVPVEKGRSGKVPMKDLRIAYYQDWQRNHWRTIFSAYNSSPFFEYYCDHFIRFFENKYKFLFDFNVELIREVLDVLNLDVELNLTESYSQNPECCDDFREMISPKNTVQSGVNTLPVREYTQVFSEKFGFIPELSIIDLIFNEGPGASDYL
jgi:hypothetical protein